MEESCKTCKHLEGCALELLQDNIKPKGYICENFELEDLDASLEKPELPSGFKEGKCKCGNSYGYCGLDIGMCVKCLDASSEKSEEKKNGS